MKKRIRIRRAGAGDIDAMLAIKQALAMPTDGQTTTSGGFLLGVGREVYAMLVEHANVLLLEDGTTGEIGGLAVTIADELLRTTDIWARRRMIVRDDGNSDAALWLSIESSRIGYFDQLAVLPRTRYRFFAPALAMAAFQTLVDSNHQHIFATIVREPIHNLAAVALLEGAGARLIGSIDEHYPDIGRILSSVYHIDCTTPSWLHPTLATRIRTMLS